MRACYVVNCTGPDLDVTRSHDPLVRDLLARPAARARTRSASGSRSTRRARSSAGAAARDAEAHVIGTLRRGALLETTAIPEIRAQAARVAEALVGARRRTCSSRPRLSRLKPVGNAL